MAGTVMRRRLARHLKEAGLAPIRFHDLRDTAATLMPEDGFPIHRVARILGHDDPAMTLRRYVHTLSELEQEGAKRLERWAF
jgi:integrase